MKYQIEKPADKDLFDSSGHSNAADAIKHVISKQSDIHAIGLEGELGSGKSTVLRLLEQKLPEEEYKFITFDVEQFHHSSTKASFIKHFRDCVIDLFGSDPSTEAKRTKRKVQKAADRALGNDLTYTKKVTSNLSWYTISFAISLMFSVRYAKDSLEHILNTTHLFFSKNHTYTFGIEETITTLLGLSPIAVALLMRYQRSLESNKKEDDKKVPNIGDIFKRNSEDKITEKLHVTREVGASELKQAFQKIVSAIPSNKCVILVIDNLDRVDNEKVREVWSDLETFTSFEGNNLRVIVPFSEKHVAAALSNNDTADGSEFILKRLPVKFRTPPVVSAGWREPFEYYWNETLPKYENLDLCAELIDLWIAPSKQITPRFLKAHINEVAVTLASNPEAVSPVACSAYLLAQRSNKLSFKDIISSNYEQKDDSLEQLISWTHKILRKILTDDEWASQIMAIHYQTRFDVARSELLESPLKSAISRSEFEDFFKLTSLFGFNIVFKRLLATTDPYEYVKLISNANFKNKQHCDWITKWLPHINNHLSQERNNCLGYNQEIVDSYNIILNAEFDIHTYRLISEHIKISNDIKEEIDKGSYVSDLLPQLYNIESIIGHSKSPHFIKRPTPEMLVNILWEHVTNFPEWNIQEKPRNMDLIKLLNYVLESDLQLTSGIVENIAEFFKLGQVNLSGEGKKTLKSSRSYFDIEFTEQQYSHILLCSDFCTQKVSEALIDRLPEINSKSAQPKWTALAIVSTLASNSSSIAYADSYFLDYILDNYYEDKSVIPYLENYLAFANRMDNLLSSVHNDALPSEIKTLIYSYIGMNRVNALNISSITDNHYPKMKECLDKGILKSTLESLLGWRKFVFDDDKNSIINWKKEFLTDALTINSDWQVFVTDWFDSKDRDENFWYDSIISKSPQLQLIVDWYLNNNKKLIKSSIITSTIIDNQETLFNDKETADLVTNLLKILPTKSSGKVKREISTKILSEQHSPEKKYNLITNFGKQISLPPFESNASKRIVIHLIENANSQVIIDWFEANFDTLLAVKWETHSVDLSQAIKNSWEQYEIDKLKEFVLEELEGESMAEKV
jgi:energy-coupling factor transporter ATP-binding protein EcfA2